jgi:hypothetical protein
MSLIDMARTMLGEYKTPERFWSEAVNTACHAINRLYLHRLLKKTSYELLTGNKPNVSYFHVFGSKCYILVKKDRHSKFAPKAVEEFLLGYDSNTKAYRVFNKSLGLVEVSSDVVFDETNGSPREQVDLDDIDEDEVLTVAMRTMAIGDVRPQEPQEQDQSSSSTLVHPPTQDGEQVPQEEGHDQGGAHEEHDKEEEASQIPPTQVRSTIQRNRPVDQILGDISKGVTTRSRLANFCEHYSFVSSIEPFSVEEALQDPDWVLAVGAKAKTPPFARGLRRTRCTNGDKTTGRLTLRLIRRRTKTRNEVVSSCDLVQNGGPRVIRPIVTGPAWPLRVTGLICKGLPVITVCNPALWEYSGDNLGVL